VDWKESYICNYILFQANNLNGSEDLAEEVDLKPINQENREIQDDTGENSYSVFNADGIPKALFTQKIFFRYP